MLYPVNIPRFGSAVRSLDWEMGDGVVWGSVKIPGSFNGGKMNYYFTSLAGSYMVSIFSSRYRRFQSVQSREL